MAINDAVRKAFEGEQAAAYEHAFLSELLVNWRDCEKSINRTTVLLVLACGVSELVIRGATSEVAVAGVRITDLAILYAILPVVIAYLYSSLMFLAAESSMNETAFKSILITRQPALWQARLGRLLYPSNMTFFAGDRLRFGFGKKAKLHKYVDLAAGARTFVLVIAPVFYEVLLFWRLFLRAGTASITLWLALCLSTLLIASALIGLIAASTVWDYED
ncbi:hypothetical protein [Geodermatophilus poikilotrophus]|uniref:Uncharacterized protein n=1 Tax=Geodermatophilus poikilotrophus TaxID=1333667 RepID=A0A1H9ZQJ9_9ACTN|nr:hypothetical protein [Geodermatophilus poikilotrophus]SES83920.1 hypothetical protein SAMN04488546_0727 [Geodermatophilus poikilotrophus]